MSSLQLPQHHLQESSAKASAAILTDSIVIPIADDPPRHNSVHELSRALTRRGTLLFALIFRAGAHFTDGVGRRGADCAKRIARRPVFARREGDGVEDAKAETEPTRRCNSAARCMKSKLREAETGLCCCKCATPSLLGGGEK